LERLSAAGRVRVTRGLGAVQIASWAWSPAFPMYAITALRPLRRERGRL